MKTRCTDRRREGFTLNELIVVVLLIGVTFFMAVSNHLRHQPVRMLDRATMQIASDLCTARMKALSASEPVVVSFPDNASYTFWTDFNTNGTADAGETETHTLDVPQLEIKTTASSSTFSPRGTLGGNRRFWLARLTVGEAGSRYVYVLPSGQVRWTDQPIDWDAHEDD